MSDTKTADAASAAVTTTEGGPVCPGSVVNQPSPQSVGAVDLSNCHYRICSCGYCKVCGHPKHSAVHGPVAGQPPGSKPYDHEYVPASAAAELMMNRPYHPCPWCGKQVNGMTYHDCKNGTMPD